MKILIFLSFVALFNFVSVGNSIAQTNPAKPTPTPSPKTFDEIYLPSKTDLKNLSPSPSIFGDDLATRTKAAIKKGEYDAILAEINAILAKNKKNADALALRGDVYLAQNKTELARADYSQAIKLSPKTSLYYYKRGMSFQKAPGYDPKASAADNDKALELDPANSDALTEKGYNFNRDKKPSEAKAAFTAAAASDPSNVFAFYQLGAIAVAEKDTAAAIDAFTRAIAADPTYQYSYASRADVYASLKDYDRAFADYAKLIELFPKLESGYGNRATLYLTTGKYGLAVQDLTKILTFTSSPDIYLRRRAWFYEIWGKYDEARVDYEAYLKKNTWDNETIKTYEALVTKINTARAGVQELSANFNAALEAYSPLEDEIGKRMKVYLELKRKSEKPSEDEKKELCMHIPYLRSLTDKALIAFNPIELLYISGKLKGFSEQLDFAEDRIPKIHNTKKMLDRDKLTYVCRDSIDMVE